ncbi:MULTISPECIES: hypothetical protein [unclassified Actinomyces]|uniref:hypothetical protein n=1 Tax=unclassified Actinomyces TaxID=2609248 RepID=UPI002017F3FD|nr:MULTISPECIES: hypothetical protein [unclassified Actinomyces]MCL3777291.1 hypothetical protein [Actinomyces sp. AC-20-1]MCL3789576.1 hypothetical protein [Actinomyces sp. 187325]MCL3791861.1 hypothetical protein [Actinomyces sp. 186855]MCL3793653.1 hypothetical protein [Actinomyces sp. 217892]
MDAAEEPSRSKGPDHSPWRRLARATGESVQRAGRAVPALTGTPFARTVATAMSSRPHARAASSVLLGASLLTTGLRYGGREAKRLKAAGYGSSLDEHSDRRDVRDDASRAARVPVPGDPAALDLDELVHVHGRRLPRIMAASGIVTALGRQGREQRVMDRSHAVGSLHTVMVSERDAVRVALPWTRLCVDTDSAASALSILDQRHLDVVVALPGRAPGEYEADLRLLLPGALPALPPALADRPRLRLHLLGRGRVAYDDGADAVTLDGVAHAYRGSLLLAGGRVVRAELWVSDRFNAPAWVVNNLG